MPSRGRNIGPMTDNTISEKWKQLAIEIGQQIRATVNTAEMIGTSNETGYVLMFFNAQGHKGKSTLVSSCTDKSELKKLLEFALRSIDGPKSSIVEPTSG